MEDLRVGMDIEGLVSNVTAFGAFVDVGVHQDGLVHISQLADRFVKDAHEVVRVGDKLRVWVLEVDLPRKRIALTARSQAARAQAATENAAARNGAAPGGQGGQPPRPNRGGEGRLGRDDRSRGGHRGGQGPTGGGSNDELRHNPFAKLRSL